VSPAGPRPPAKAAAFIGRMPPWSMQAPAAQPLAITSGGQLIAPFTGAPSSALNLSANVGPNALLVSASYPLPSSNSAGPLTTVPLPGGYTYWRIDNGSSGQFTMPELWGSLSQAYVYNNTPSNLGGIVGAGGLKIDGYTYPSGTYVFQFMDFSQGIISSGGYIYASGGPSVLFRGCRFRGPLAAPGAISVEAADYEASACAHYCDFGGQGASNAQTCVVGLDLGGGSQGTRQLRCYTSYVTTGLQPNCEPGYFCDAIENMVEKLTLFYGPDGPDDDGPYHLNGICVNGGNPNWLCLRNNVVSAATDEQGNTINQTDCIAMFQDFGTFPGTGTNSDGSTGYFLENNYVGGTGYSYYFGQNEGTMPDTVNNLTVTGNLLTTAEYPTGGSNGAAAAIPTWGSYGNSESGNLWADGPNAGTSFL
jgi:hypothetical protein